MTPEQAMVSIKARNMLIQHIEMCLLQLKLLAGKKEESVEQTKENLKIVRQDSFCTEQSEKVDRDQKSFASFD
jgi:hypothetical protein